MSLKEEQRRYPIIFRCIRPHNKVSAYSMRETTRDGEIPRPGCNTVCEPAPNSCSAGSWAALIAPALSRQPASRVSRCGLSPAPFHGSASGGRQVPDLPLNDRNRDDLAGRQHRVEINPWVVLPQQPQGDVVLTGCQNPEAPSVFQPMLHDALDVESAKVIRLQRLMVSDPPLLERRRWDV